MKIARKKIVRKFLSFFPRWKTRPQWEHSVAHARSFLPHKYSAARIPALPLMNADQLIIGSMDNLLPLVPAHPITSA
jgi:hypothetical protein